MTYFNPQAGLGVDFGFSTDDIARQVVNAVMPAVEARMPQMINAAWPTIEGKLPGLVPQLVGPAVNSAIPAITAQVPNMVKGALPTLYAQLPQIAAKIKPVLEVQAKALAEAYAKQYLGPMAPMLKFMPILALVGISVSLFGSGIVIYNFWKRGY